MEVDLRELLRLGLREALAAGTIFHLDSLLSGTPSPSLVSVRLRSVIVYFQYISLEDITELASAGLLHSNSVLGLATSFKRLIPKRSGLL